MKTYVIGHKNPDTDSIVSAIAAAKLFNCEPAKSGELNKETKYILNTFGIDVPKNLPEEEKKVILVDHNSPDESLASPEELIAIYDHHKLSNPHTPEPINVRIETIGSTAALIAKMFYEKEVTISKEIASILICAIMSDTLKFTSPTTTKEDKEMADKLNKIAQIDLDKTSKEMFEAKSDISGISAEELLGKDYKVFDMDGKKVGIGVWETTNPNSILNRKSEIHQALRDKKEKEGLDHIFFAAIDIIGGAAHFILDTQPEIALIEETFEIAAEEGVAYIKDVVSRKKQITPKIEETLKGKHGL